MRTTIDKAGRIVVPKKLRDRLGLVAGTEIDIDEDGSGLRVEPVHDKPRAWVEEREDGPVIVGDGSWTLTVESVREMVEEIRDRRL